VLTLFTTPVIYLGFESLARRLRGSVRTEPVEVPVAGGASTGSARTEGGQ
jgi:hypothetical protein